MKKYRTSLEALFLMVFYFLLLVSFLTCSKDESLIGTRPIDTYSYIGYDSSGIAINQGWIKYRLTDSYRVKGEWHLESINYIKNIGQQIGNGELTGEIHSDTIFFNLNPPYLDNNVILIGNLLSDKISGVWQWITYAGLTNWGTFRAEK